MSKIRGFFSSLLITTVLHENHEHCTCCEGFPWLCVWLNKTILNIKKRLYSHGVIYYLTWHHVCFEYFITHFFWVSNFLLNFIANCVKLLLQITAALLQVTAKVITNCGFQYSYFILRQLLPIAAVCFSCENKSVKKRIRLACPF